MSSLHEKNQCQSEEIIETSEKVWHELNLFDTPYFSRLKNKTMNKTDFFKSQRAFFHAVAYFSRPMAVLASRIDSTEARLSLIENIYEEHGEMDQEAFHENTFIKWLNQLHPQSPENKESIPLEPCVEAFNAALMGICQMAPVEKGVCCLGMIEFMFAHISKFIADTTVELGWIAPENLVHYHLHADLDIQHSKELFEVVDQIAETDPAQCMEGIHLGAFIFNRLYNDLANFKA